MGDYASRCGALYGTEWGGVRQGGYECDVKDIGKLSSVIAHSLNNYFISKAA